MAHMVETMAYAGELPWHGLGTKVEDNISVDDMLKESGLVQSTSEAMRLVKQGAVKINDEKIDDPKLSIAKNQELLVQVGKRRFLKIKT